MRKIAIELILDLLPIFCRRFLILKTTCNLLILHSNFFTLLCSRCRLHRLSRRIVRQIHVSVSKRVVHVSMGQPANSLIFLWMEFRLAVLSLKGYLNHQRLFRLYQWSTMSMHRRYVLCFFFILFESCHN